MCRACLCAVHVPSEFRAWSGVVLAAAQTHSILFCLWDPVPNFGPAGFLCIFLPAMQLQQQLQGLCSEVIMTVVLAVCRRLAVCVCVCVCVLHVCVCLQHSRRCVGLILLEPTCRLTRPCNPSTCLLP